MRRNPFLLLSAGLIVSMPLGTSASAHLEGRSVARDLEIVAGRRIYFGHQSVGQDLLEGLRELARDYGVSLRIVGDGSPSALAEPGIVHDRLGENTRPLTKLEAFVGAMDRDGADRADVALFKFCYVDFGPGTDVRALFERYVAAHEQLRARHPGVSFLHVTVPLTSMSSGFAAYLKGLLGRPVAGAIENVKRHEFNELLRSWYRDREPFFDLALAESTLEDGRPCGFDWNGKTYPCLAPEFTEDGGHLNPRGRLHAARAFASALAGAGHP